MAALRGQDDANSLGSSQDQVSPEPEQQREAAAVPTTERVQTILGGGAKTKGQTSGQGPRGNGLEFGSGEHQEQGNEGARRENADKKHDEPHRSKNPTDPFFKFELTHGDIVMLSGDYFDPREKNERGEPVSDSLFKLAGRPSKNIGKEVGTQDEIVYAINDAVPHDPRFAKGGIWEHVKFSPEVIESVNNRYLQLAAHNFEHFVNPDGKGGGPKSANRHSAGGSYRALHEQAVHEAHRAKSTGESVDTAMSHEAAAEHFLTDSFSAGHIRTPRESIATYWNAKYPLFFENLKKTIARDVAIYVNAHDDNMTTTFLSVRDFHENILPAIDAATASIPAVGMDAIVATLTHDMDNDVGLDVKNDAGQKWHTMGDSHASDPATHEHVVQAVQLGVNDIQHAYSLPPTLDEKKVEMQVRAETTAPAKAGNPKYGPEQLMPYPDPESKENGQLGWKQPDFATLWKTPIRSGQAATYGEKILESMATGDFGKQLKSLGNLFPEVQDVAHGVNHLHPRAGYTEGFLKDLKDPTKTQRKLQEIIDYDPGKGVNSTDEDNATTADIERLQQQGVDAQQAGDKKAGKDSKLKGLTLQQRFDYIHNLESTQGAGTSELEQDEIIELFKTATWDDRRVLFKMLEHREWEGKLKGWKAIGDDIWINLDHDHIVKFEKMMDS